jgi:predicted CXXCH cytochrome family protein
MQAEITFLTRRGTAVMRRSRIVSADNIRFGRGTDNEVPLADIRVELTAATLRPGADGLFIQRLGDSPVRVNGETSGTLPVGPGDEILIGPYRIVLGNPPGGLDAALSVELVEPAGDSLQRLLTQSRIGLDRTRLSKRRTSWVLFFILTLLCLAIPIVLYTMGDGGKRNASAPANGVSSLLAVAWNPGEISNPHRYFAQDCAACHQTPFAVVKDSACLNCHSGIGNHIASDTESDVAPVHRLLRRTRCAECHEEHRGLRGLVIREGALCVGCHRSLVENMPNAGLRDVRGFPDGHPEFRVTLVSDAVKGGLHKVDLDTDPKPDDRPNLIFSHAAHLVPEGFPALGYKPMICGDCHVAEPGGQGFLAITYKGQCQRCHALRFDAEPSYLRAKPEVPHGDDARVKTDVQGFYSSLALQGGVEEVQAPDIIRRVPGTPFAPDEEQRLKVQDWVARKTKEALAIVFFEPRRGCAYCHVVERGADTLRVEPVKMLTRFLAPARFDHAKHTPIDCGDCHQAKASQTSSDVLIPGKERCVTCHGAEAASFNVQSTCTSCHVFHRQEMGPMRQIVEVER